MIDATERPGGGGTPPRLDQLQSEEACTANDTAVDRAEAERFLQALDPDPNAIWHFRTFGDREKGTGRNYAGTLAACWPELCRDNAEQRGVFVVVNDGGHRAADITRIRSLFVDLDGAPLEPALAAVGAAVPGLDAGIIVDSSPGRWHAYWPVDAERPLAVEHFRDLQKRLISLTGADPAVHDLSRVMRLPGFLHQKAEPHLVRVSTLEHHRYPAPMLLKLPVVASAPPPIDLPPAPATATAAPNLGNLSGVGDRLAEQRRDADLKRLRAALEACAAVVASTPEGERNVALNSRTAYAAGVHIGGQYLHLGEVSGRMEAAGIAAGLDADAVRATVRSAAEFGRGSPIELVDRPRDADPPKDTIRQKVDGDRPQLRLIRSVVNADLPEHAERSVLGPYLPRGEVTLLAGHGGCGKTTLAASWAVAVSAGLPWAGAKADVGRVLFASFEDSAPRCRTLLKRACRAAGVPYSAAEHVDLIDGTESADGALWIGDDRGRAMKTKAATELEDAVAGGAYELVIVDNSSETFAANENSRADVRGFVRWLKGLARDADCAVLLLAHVNAQTARNGGGGQSFSGSTAWHNSVRSRLAITTDKGSLALALEKRQYGRPVEDLKLRFDDDADILVPVGVITEKPRGGQQQPRPMSEEDADLQRRQVEAEHDSLILGAMVKAIAAGDLPGLNRKGPGNARAALEAYGVDIAHGEFWAAVDRMQADGRLRIAETVKANRHARQHYAPAAESVKVA